jgi:hypothetical protein
VRALAGTVTSASALPTSTIAAPVTRPRSPPLMNAKRAAWVSSRPRGLPEAARDHQQPGGDRALAPDPVGQAPADKHQAAVDERVRVHDPLQLMGSGVQVPHQRRQRDVKHGAIKVDDQNRDAQHGEREPARKFPPIARLGSTGTRCAWTVITPPLAPVTAQHRTTATSLNRRSRAVPATALSGPRKWAISPAAGAECPARPQPPELVHPRPGPVGAVSTEPTVRSG